MGVTMMVAVEKGHCTEEWETFADSEIPSSLGSLFKRKVSK